MLKSPVALQSHTIREPLVKDLVGTIKAVADMGYKGIEGSPPRNCSPGEWRRIIEDHGMRLIGASTGLTEMMNGLPQLVENCNSMGVNTLMMGLWAELNESNGDWKRLVADLEQAATKATAEGLRILYHNHAFEFESRVDGMYALDYIFASIDASVLQAEIDTYWVATGGEDPVAYIRKYAGRLPFLHLKDRQKDVPREQQRAFAEVGAGSLDWNAILDAANDTKIEWFIVEQDQTDLTPLESARISLEYLKGRQL